MIRNLGKPNGGDDFYGDSKEAHSELMAALWCPIIDIAIILSFYTYRRYAVIIHGIVGSFICLFSVITSLAIIGKTGMLD
jgi:hypothetical protein